MLRTPPRPRSRCGGFELADDIATAFFSDHITVDSANAKKLWKFKKKEKWAIVARHSAAVTSLLKLTGGLPPKQRRTHDQLSAWLSDHEMQWCAGDIEKSIYGLRQMVRTLRNHKTRGPPKKFAKLGRMIDELIPAQDPENRNDGSDDSGGDDDDCTMIEEESTPEKTSAPMIEEISDDSEDGAPLISDSFAADEADLQSLERRLFDRRVKYLVKTKVAEKEISSPLIADLDLDAMVKEAEVACEKPLLPSSYKIFKGLKKRPAASKKKKRKKHKHAEPAEPSAEEYVAAGGDCPWDEEIGNWIKKYFDSPPTAVVKRRVYSCAFHKIRKRSLNRGLSTEESAAAARTGGKVAVLKWCIAVGV